VDPIFRCNGEYFGFLHKWRLFDSRGYYLGWVDEGEVWRGDGAFLGELVDGCYVLRRKGAVRSPRVPPDPRSPPVPPSPSAPRPFRQPRAGWEDALDEF
jgi:hypothetical protein